MTKRDLYFVMQKLIGVFVLVLTALLVVFCEGDLTIGLVTLPIGLTLIFGRNKYIICDFADQF